MRDAESSRGSCVAHPRFAVLAVELSQPEVLDRRVREDWEARGGTDLYARCHVKAQDIRAEHHPEPLPNDVQQRIRKIVEETDCAVGVS